MLYHGDYWLSLCVSRLEEKGVFVYNDWNLISDIQNGQISKYNFKSNNSIPCPIHGIIETGDITLTIFTNTFYYKCNNGEPKEVNCEQLTSIEAKVISQQKLSSNPNLNRINNKNISVTNSDDIDKLSEIMHGEVTIFTSAYSDKMVEVTNNTTVNHETQLIGVTSDNSVNKEIRGVTTKLFEEGLRVTLAGDDKSYFLVPIVEQYADIIPGRKLLIRSEGKDSLCIILPTKNDRCNVERISNVEPERCVIYNNINGCLVPIDNESSAKESTRISDLITEVPVEYIHLIKNKRRNEQRPFIMSNDLYTLYNNIKFEKKNFPNVRLFSANINKLFGDIVERSEKVGSKETIYRDGKRVQICGVYFKETAYNKIKIVRKDLDPISLGQYLSETLEKNIKAEPKKARRHPKSW